MLSLFWAVLYTLCSKEVEREAHIELSQFSTDFQNSFIGTLCKNLSETNCY